MKRSGSMLWLLRIAFEGIIISAVLVVVQPFQDRITLYAEATLKSQLGNLVDVGRMYSKIVDGNFQDMSLKEELYVELLDKMYEMSDAGVSSINYNIVMLSYQFSDRSPNEDVSCKLRLLEASRYLTNIDLGLCP